MTDKIVVFSTCRDPAEAEIIARHLLEKRLAACVNIVPGVRSLYWWQGKVEESGEQMLIIKSRRDLLPDLSEELARVHSYQVPEVVAVPVVDGAPSYLQWVERELRPGRDG